MRRVEAKRWEVGGIQRVVLASGVAPKILERAGEWAASTGRDLGEVSSLSRC